MNFIMSAFFTASLSVLGRLFTQAFFESLLTKIILWGGEKLVAMNTNDLSPAVFTAVKDALSTQNGAPKT